MDAVTLERAFLDTAGPAHATVAMRYLAEDDSELETLCSEKTVEAAQYAFVTFLTQACAAHDALRAKAVRAAEALAVPKETPARTQYLLSLAGLLVRMTQTSEAAGQPAYLGMPRAAATYLLDNAGLATPHDYLLRTSVHASLRQDCLATQAASLFFRTLLEDQELRGLDADLPWMQALHHVLVPLATALVSDVERARSAGIALLSPGSAAMQYVAWHIGRVLLLAWRVLLVVARQCRVPAHLKVLTVFAEQLAHAHAQYEQGVGQADRQAVGAYATGLDYFRLTAAAILRPIEQQSPETIAGLDEVVKVVRDTGAQPAELLEVLEEMVRARARPVQKRAAEEAPRGARVPPAKKGPGASLELSGSTTAEEADSDSDKDDAMMHARFLSALRLSSPPPSL